MNAMFRLGQRLLPGLLATTLGALALTSAHAGGTPWIRDADNPDRNRFQVAATGTLQAPFVNGFVMVPTPKGKRYFIDYVTLNCTLNSATDSVTQVYLSVLQTTAATSASTSAVPFQMQRIGPAPFGGVIWSASAQVSMFSDPNIFAADGGTGITFNIFHTEGGSAGTCQAFVAGHTLRT